MAVKKKQAALKKQLKKKVKILERKEEKSRHQLRDAIDKTRKLGMAYKSKLAKKVRLMKSKMSDAQLSTYYKLAANIEKQLLQAVHTKAKAIADALAQLEMKYAPKFSMNEENKGKKPRKMRKVKRVKVKRSVKRGRKKVSSK